MVRHYHKKMFRVHAGSEDRMRKRTSSLPEYESSDESDLDTQNLTRAMVNLSMRPFGRHPKRSRVEDDANVGGSLETLRRTLLMHYSG